MLQFSIYLNNIIIPPIAVTIIIPIPLTPDLDKPNKKTAKLMAIHCNAVKLYD